jgi:dipeptidase E
VTTPRIVAIGGGPLDEPNVGPLIRFLIELTGKRRPRVLFLPTATGDVPSYAMSFYATFALIAEASHLDLFDRRTDDLRPAILEQDLIFVGGGNTANLLAIWRVHGLDALLREAWETGVVLSGVSAGANCWFESSVTDSFGPLAALPTGLGLLSGSFCPHFDGEPLRRPRFHELIGSGGLPAGYAADEEAAIVFEGRSLAEVVAGRRGAAGYRVERDGDGVREQRLEARYLGDA